MFFITKLIFFVVPILLSVAFLTLFERKLLSIVGVRLGPNKASLVGLLQPVGDAIKLSNKQINFLSNFAYFFYYLSSFFSILLSLFLWVCAFADPMVVSLKFSVVVLMLVLGFNSLSMIISGWSSFGKYPLIGSLRSVAQLVSYEAVLYFCFFFFFFFFFCFSFSDFSYFYTMPLFIVMPLLFYVWLPSILADLNRTPYDFSEGESELVSGFNTEFGSLAFTLLFLSEYSNIVFFSLLSSFLFFYSFFYFYFFFSFFLFIVWIRSVLPRFRFDKLMMVCWKFFIPFSTILLFLYIC